MNNALITILSLSASGSLLGILILAEKPLLKNRVTKAFSYYIWILVLLRLVVPVSAPVSIMGSLFGPEQHISDSTTTERSDAAAGNATVPANEQPPTAAPNAQIAPAGMQSGETARAEAVPDAGKPLSIWNLIVNNLFGIWLAGSFVSLGWFVAAYICFSRRIRRSCVPPHRDDLAVFERMREGRNVRMACSSRVDTPMLIGIVRPVIVLPQLAYVQNGMSGELENILRHELTHYRRKDVLYKWFAVAATSIHWFNPFMPLIRREISRACELSCDEAVIAGMSAEEKQFYGNTLLALSANGRLSAGILSTTLCENKKELKERLVSIMRYKGKSASAAVLAAALALLLAGCAMAFGAANGSGGEGTPSSGETADGTAYSRKMDGTIINWRDNGCSYSLDSAGNVTLSYDNGKTAAKAPLTLQPGGSVSADAVGFYISSEKTAIAYGGADETVTVLTSDDMGKTWSSADILLDGAEASWNCIGFTSQNDGWLVICSFVGMGREQHYIYMTADGGKTWKPVSGNVNDIYAGMLSGAGFASDKVGFLCFRYETDFQPAICVTRDGGLTWSRLSVSLPKEYDGYNKTPLSPALDGTDIILPVLLTDDSGEAGTVYLVSDDEGETWQCKTELSGEAAPPATGEASPKPAASADPAALSAYKAVLLGNAGFYETGIKKTLDISQLNQAVSSDSKTVAKATRFVVVDLDNDGIMEVILWLNVNGLDDYGFEILRYQDGVVYGYVMWYRAFNQLKMDGTFSFSSSAMNSGVGILRFGEGTYSTFKVAYREANYDIDGNPVISYIVNNEIATQEEFDAVFDKQSEKPDAVWHDFTDDNIETELSGAWR
jgi:beta-lactamase regulating signal transducer with metallopeptidase domain/photosystem II stability/assembly factor-like uncharacterized protein